MRAEIVLGIVLGAFFGMMITKLEREMSLTGHAITGSIAGASLGGLAMARLTEKK